jgi:hypothetical protein
MGSELPAKLLRTSKSRWLARHLISVLLFVNSIVMRIFLPCHGILSDSDYLCIILALNLGLFSAIDLATYVTYRTLSDNWEIIPSKAIGCPLTLIPIHSRAVNRDLWVSVSYDRVSFFTLSELVAHVIFACNQSGIEPDDRIFDDPAQEDT